MGFLFRAYHRHAGVRHRCTSRLQSEVRSWPAREVSDGSRFSITREQVFPGQWKTAKLRIHVNGSLLLLKSFSRDEDSYHYGFKKVANNLLVARRQPSLARTLRAASAPSHALPAKPGLSTDDLLFVVQLAQDAHATSNIHSPC